MARAKEQMFFTAFIGLVMLGALFVAKDWPIRASIIILLLGSIGVVLALFQLRLDFKAARAEGAKILRPTFGFRPSSIKAAGGAWKSGRGSGDFSSRSILSASSSRCRCLFSYTSSCTAAIG